MPQDKSPPPSSLYPLFQEGNYMLGGRGDLLQHCCLRCEDPTLPPNPGGTPSAHGQRASRIWPAGKVKPRWAGESPQSDSEGLFPQGPGGQGCCQILLGRSGPSRQQFHGNPKACVEMSAMSAANEKRIAGSEANASRGDGSDREGVHEDLFPSNVA